MTDTLRVLDPVTEPEVATATLAPRLGSLDGKVIGLYANGKLNADKLMDLVQAELAARHPVAGFVRGTYSAGEVHTRDQWSGLEGCDAVILTHGD